MINSSAVAYDDPTEDIHSDGFEAHDYCHLALNL